MAPSANPPPFKVTVLLAAPLPVGRRVEYIVFVRNLGILSARLQPDHDEPMIIDCETGIVYGRLWHYFDLTSYSEEKSFPTA